MPEVCKRDGCTRSADGATIAGGLGVNLVGERGIVYDGLGTARREVKVDGVAINVVSHNDGIFPPGGLGDVPGDSA